MATGFLTLSGYVSGDPTGSRSIGPRTIAPEAPRPSGNLFYTSSAGTAFGILIPDDCSAIIIEVQQAAGTIQIMQNGLGGQTGDYLCADVGSFYVSCVDPANRPPGNQIWVKVTGATRLSVQHI